MLLLPQPRSSHDKDGCKFAALKLRCCWGTRGQLKHRPLVAARTHSNLPCERGGGKTPKLKSHRNQALGLDLPRSTSASSSSFTQSLSCEVTLRRGTGRREGLTWKALLQAVYINLGCCDGELLLLFNCLEANGSAQQRAHWKMKAQFRFRTCCLQDMRTQNLDLCHRPIAISSDRMSAVRLEVSTSFRSSTWRRPPKVWRTAHKHRNELQQSSGAKVAALVKVPCTWNALPVGSNSLPSSNFICGSATFSTEMRTKSAARLGERAASNMDMICLLRNPPWASACPWLSDPASRVGQNCGRHELTANLQKPSQQGAAEHSQPPAPPLPHDQTCATNYGHAACSAPVDERPRLPTGAPTLRSAECYWCSRSAWRSRIVLTQQSPCGSAPAPRRRWMALKQCLQSLAERQRLASLPNRSSQLWWRWALEG